MPPDAMPPDAMPPDAMAQELHGNVAFVTGAAHGQGRAACLALAGAGAHIAALDVARPLAYPAYAMGQPEELTSLVGQCEVRLQAQAGDLYSEFYTDETVGAPNPDTLTSQIEFVIPNMAAGQVDVLNYTYTIHCMQPSSHVDAFELRQL